MLPREKGETPGIWLILRKDPFVWVGLATFGVVLALYFLPILGAGQRVTLSDSLGDCLLLAAVVLALQNGLRQIDHPEERRFWNLLTAAFVAYVSVKVSYFFLPREARTMGFYLATDVSYLLFYALAFFAAASNPHLRRRWSADNRLYRLESAGGIVFVVGLLTYFVLIPSSFSQTAYDTFAPSLLLFLALDGFVLLSFFYLRRTCHKPRWRRIYGFLALAFATWTALDFAEYLMYVEVLTDPPRGSRWEIPWLLPYLPVIVAARLRGLPAEARGQRIDTPGTDGQPLGFRGPLLLYASALPLFHFGFYALGLLDADSRPAREVCLFAYVLLLGGFALAHDRLLRGERKGARERIYQSERHYRALFEQSIDAIYITSTDGEFLDANDAMLKLFGYSRDEMMELNVRELYVDPDDRKEFQQEIETNGSVSGYAVRFRNRDGSMIECRDSATVRRDSQGEIVGYQGIIHDVTEQKRAFEELQESRHRFKSLVDSVDGIVWEADAQTFQFSFVSRQAERLLGYPVERWLEEPDFWVEHIHPDDRDFAVDYCRRATAEMKDHDFEYRMIDADGETVWLRDIVTIMVENDRPSAIRGIMLDITDQKAAEDALRQSEEQLRQAQKMEAIGQLAGGVAHDFNNMLTGIIAHTELALYQLPENSPVSRKLKKAREFADSAANLTRQLLAFGRRRQLEPEVLNINSQVENTLEMLARIIGEDIELEFIPDPDLGSVRADRTHIEQALVNLAVNARDAMPDGGTLTIATSNKMLDTRYTDAHHGVAEGPYVMLAVSDTGCGMDLETQERIFEPFFTTKEVGKGTGLGLSVLYGSIQQHGGHVWVYSEPGLGTTFKIYLPRVDEEAIELGDIDRDERPRGSETILLVEDEAGVRAVVEEVLREQGYEVLSIGRPEEAEQLFSENDNEIVLLLTDVVLPGYDGRELYRRLSEEHSALKVLYMSGYTDRVVERSSLLHADAAFIEKPFTPAALALKLREVLDR